MGGKKINLSRNNLSFNKKLQLTDDNLKDLELNGEINIYYGLETLSGQISVFKEKTPLVHVSIATAFVFELESFDGALLDVKVYKSIRGSTRIKWLGAQFVRYAKTVYDNRKRYPKIR